ncbi:site-2 protease family protein [Anaerofustis sp.]|uniref:site-2 protease family protein n=1 Tax=Anaerofustis sp. TaxID=1872517 RepID=UPI0025C5A028|nr:site-2 protease family protein [Anaerofustis sp.]
MKEDKNKEIKTFDDYLMPYLTDDENILNKEKDIDKDSLLFTGKDIQEKKAEDFSFEEEEREEESSFYEEKKVTEEEAAEERESKEVYENAGGRGDFDMLPNLVLVLSVAVIIGMVMFKGVGVFHGIESIIFAFVWASVLSYVSIIVHEGGHLVFGLLSGYKFASFRIGSMMFIKNDGRMTYKRYNIPGTGGQCLMIPPECGEDYDFPYFLYNFGGAIFNVLFAVICFLLYVSLPYILILSEGFIIGTALGLYFALLNGIPRKIGGIANDGANALYLDEDKISKKALYNQLRINGLLTKGVRFKDMDERLFDLESYDSDCKNPLVSVMYSFRCNYLIDKREFDEARELINYSLDNLEEMLSVHKSELKCELLFLALLDGEEESVIDEIYDEDLKRYINTTKKYYVARRRQLYAYELFYNKDEEAAESELEAFEIIAGRYPYETEVEGEIELLHLVHDRALERGIIQEEDEDDGEEI